MTHTEKDINYGSSSTTQLVRERSMQSFSNVGRSSNSEGYEELFKDSVPCPTCRGLGRIHKDLEGELVALIPLKDKRLKPRRTVLYVGMAIAFCTVFAGLLIFFLFPRDIVVSSDRPLLEPLSLSLNLTASYVNFTTMNFYNFSNNNFFPVKITGAQMASMYDEKIISVAVNNTIVEIPTRSTLNYGIVTNFFLSSDNDWFFLVKFCADSRPWVHNLPITFELTASYTYLGHMEQATLTTFQQVSCYNSSAED